MVSGLDQILRKNSSDANDLRTESDPVDTRTEDGW